MQPTPGPARFDAVDLLASAEPERTGVPGLAIALTDARGTIHAATFGLADLAAGKPVAPELLFEIGSIGKAFTALVLLQLAEEGRLDLAAPVRRSLPWFEVPVAGREITVDDLLTHTAGITSGIDGTPEAAYQVWALRHRRPGSPPGTRFHYSNVGYKALGLLIEQLDGLPYPEAVRRRILEPLGMRSTEPAITNGIRPRLATGHDYLDDDRIGWPGAPVGPATWLETATADGSIASTVADMATFARMLLRRGVGPNGAIVSDASFARMAHPHASAGPDLAYGYALWQRLHRGRRLIGHGGGMVGWAAGLQLDPDAGLGVVVLENGTMGAPMTLGRAILDTLRGDGVLPSVWDSDDALEITGGWSRDPDGEASGPAAFSIVADGPRLRLVGDERDVPFEPLGDGRFMAHDRELSRFTFTADPPSEPTVLWHGPGRYLRPGARLAPLARPSPELAAIAGHYRSHNPWTTNFRVFLRGDRPWLAFPAAPDAFEDEQPLVPQPDGTFRVGEDPAGPEDLRFDTVVEGRPLQAWLSGYPYHRVG